MSSYHGNMPVRINSQRSNGGCITRFSSDRPSFPNGESFTKKETLSIFLRHDLNIRTISFVRFLRYLFSFYVYQQQLSTKCRHHFKLYFLKIVSHESIKKILRLITTRDYKEELKKIKNSGHVVTFTRRRVCIENQKFLSNQ